jgi:hypothetical protein
VRRRDSPSSSFLRLRGSRTPPAQRTKPGRPDEQGGPRCRGAGGRAWRRPSTQLYLLQRRRVLSLHSPVPRSRLPRRRPEDTSLGERSVSGTLVATVREGTTGLACRRFFIRFLQRQKGQEGGATRGSSSSLKK